MLSRLKPAVGGAPQPADKRKKKGKRIPQLEELLSQRDFTGAIALLEVLRGAGAGASGVLPWRLPGGFFFGALQGCVAPVTKVVKRRGAAWEVRDLPPS